jgi:hypothetical protein
VTYINRVKPVEAISLRDFLCDTEDGFGIQMSEVVLAFEMILMRCVNAWKHAQAPRHSFFTRRNNVELQTSVHQQGINTILIQIGKSLRGKEGEKTPPTMTSTVTMELKEDRTVLSKKAAARKNSIDDAIKRTLPVVDAEQAVSFWPKERRPCGYGYSVFCCTRISAS